MYGRQVRYLDVNNKDDRGEFGERGAQRIEGGIAWTVPYLEGDDSTCTLKRGQERDKKVMEKDILISMNSSLGCGFEKEGLLRRRIIEKDLLDRGLSASARRKVEIGNRVRGLRGETDPR
jgi:hypothetical protein